MKPKKIDALFISDVHLGSRYSKAKELLATLKLYDPKFLFIVGDFIDGWLLKKKHYWNQDYTNVIKKILSLSKNNTKIIYITGNHDDFLRKYTEIQLGKNISVVDEFQIDDIFITHGDKYDGVINLKWLAVLSSVGYEIILGIDKIVKKLGFQRSVSRWAKTNIKNAVKFITNFENALAKEAEKRECNHVICGHIHKPTQSIINDINYLNCGDWIENMSYIICDDLYAANKTFQIKFYGK